MVGSFLQKLKLVVTDSTLRRRILFVLISLVLFRALAAIPIPGVDQNLLAAFFANNQFLGLFNVFSGGGLSNLSIVMLGVAPYITASIIMQVLTIMAPRLKAMYQEEGEIGRRKFTQYSRLLTVPLALLQSFAFLKFLESQGASPALSSFDLGVNVLIVAAGSLLLMWMGELITEFGIGQGVSIIIFAGIVASLPTTLSQLAFTFDPSQLPLYVGFVAVALLITLGVVIISEAERPVPVTYSKSVRGSKTAGGVSTYLPLRLNQAGVIPIIFAVSLLLLPQMVFNLLAGLGYPAVERLSSAFLTFFNNPILYGIVYFILVFFFTYFYTAVTFDPDTLATNLQRSGAFIPGVRPGTATAQHIARILTRITLVGALFLGFIAVLPTVMQSITGVAALAIGGTALLITVSVVLDLLRKIEAQISIREY
jgi:preprotein translocase subunit SecY